MHDPGSQQRPWRVRHGAVVAVLAIVLSACAGGGAHPEVEDDQLACASTAETRLAVASDDAGRAGADDDERAAAVLREVATLQFALEAIAPAEPALAAGRDEVVEATALAGAVAALVALDDGCAEADVARVFDGAEHTTAACVQLRTVAGQADELGQERAQARVRFALRYVEARSDELDDELRAHVGTAGEALGEDTDRMATGLEQAVRRCDGLRDRG